jgi:hypothetical protein
VDVRIPFLPGMIAFIRKAIPEYLFNDMLLSGRRLTATELALSNVIVSASENREELLAKKINYDSEKLWNIQKVFRGDPFLFKMKTKS